MTDGKTSACIDESVEQKFAQRSFNQASAGRRILVIDGLGGGIGVQLVGRLRDSIGDYELLAIGTNAVATERMIKAGASRGASGENAIRQMAKTANFILGPIGIIIENSMMGEITGRMSQAILASPAERILLPLQNEHLFLAGLEPLPLAKMIEKAIEYLKSRL
ncbi:MAG: DUF3842 family protein [Spirochaetaceae bacterium]|jgi:hypothetical protein|nr:DUF3842 family protein [Spirochaetaceae bacterium]